MNAPRSYYEILMGLRPQSRGLTAIPDVAAADCSPRLPDPTGPLMPPPKPLPCSVTAGPAEELPRVSNGGGFV